MENPSPPSPESQEQQYSIINTHMSLLVRYIKWTFWTVVFVYILYIGYKFYLNISHATLFQTPQAFKYFESILRYVGYFTLILTFIVGFQLWRNGEKNGIGRFHLAKGVLLISIILFILFGYQGPHINLQKMKYPTCVGSPVCNIIGRPFRSRKWFRRGSHEAELVKGNGWLLSKS